MNNTNRPTHAAHELLNDQDLEQLGGAAGAGNLPKLNPFKFDPFGIYDEDGNLRRDRLNAPRRVRIRR